MTVVLLVSTSKLTKFVKSNSGTTLVQKYLKLAFCTGQRTITASKTNSWQCVEKE